MLSSGYGMRHGFIAKYGGEGEMGRAGRGEQGSLTGGHNLHFARVPRPDVLVEVRCSPEHCTRAGFEGQGSTAGACKEPIRGCGTAKRCGKGEMGRVGRGEQAG